MFDQIRKIFGFTKVKPLPLRLILDEGDDGKYRVHAAMDIEDELVPIDNMAELMRYGASYEHPSKKGTTTYKLTTDDHQILLALASMNPENRGDHLVFDIRPTILSYLRAKGQTNGRVLESERSQAVKISDEALKPTATIDYVPGEAVHVEVGYQEPNSDVLLSATELRETGDPTYVRLGNTFIPRPEPANEQVQKWLQQPSKQVPLKDIPEFFQRDLVLLREQFSAVLTDLASQIQVIERPLRPVVRVDRAEQGWLDFSVSYEAGAVSLPHTLLTAQSGETYVQSDAFTWVKNDPKLVKKTQAQLEQLNVSEIEGGYRTAVAQFASLDQFIQSIGGRPELGAAYQAFLDQLTGFTPDENFQLSSKAEAYLKEIGIGLRPYQRAGIHWLDWLNNNHLHGLLADDMGLGKTIQTICLLRQAYEQSHTGAHSLILAPKSVIHHWQRELERFYPAITVYPYHGTQRRISQFQSLQPTIFISTYETIANDINRISQIPFFYLILDEATKIKNASARRTQAIKSLNAAHRLALSGTPVENRPAELWSLFDFLMRGHLGKQATFERLFEEKIKAGDEAASRQLGQRIKPFMLRRLKEEVAQDLPNKIHIDEWCELSPEQRTLYGGLQEEIKRLRNAIQSGERVNYTVSILPVLTKLKQICNHPALVKREHPIKQIEARSEKFDLIVSKIEEIVEKGEKVVVFSHFLDMLSLLEAVTRSRQINYIRIDGSTNNRGRLIDLFNEGDAKVALCSLSATGYGITLTAANHVIHADRWWNPALEDQATDRVHRIGQNKTVFVYRIMVEGTLEEKIDRLLSQKRDMASDIIDTARAGEHRWSREELLALLQPLD